jgi:3-dehydroquinate synthase
MKKTHVPLKKKLNHSYHVEIFSEGFEHIAKDLKKLDLSDHYIVITDSNTHRLFARDFQKALKKEKLNVDVLGVTAGEKSKKWNVTGKLLSELVRLNATRKSCIIVLGGGVVGDLAGFVASVYMRGIPYIQVPTSLLAMVDSSIGGKTGVDLPEGKNLAGSFWQPKKVYISLPVLSTLPKKQLLCGLGEVVKYGCMWDRSFFMFLRRSFRKMLRKQKKELKKDKRDQKKVVDISWLQKDEYQKFLTAIIRRSVSIKRNVVKKDEKEAGVRAMLNYGHTIGHAIEQLSNFKLNHGESISIGMHYEAKLSHQLGYLSEKELERQEALFKLIGLPTEIPPKMNRAKMIEIMKCDKKSRRGKIGCALIRRLGKPIPGFVDYLTGKRMFRLIK